VFNPFSLIFALKINLNFVMKRKMFSIMAISAIALVSCKKDAVDDRTLGTATINGTVRSDIDQSNDINGAGLYEEDYMPEGVEGMTVMVTINASQYTDVTNGSYDYDNHTISAVTDANGEFTLTIPYATEEGYDIDIEFEDVYGITRTLYSTDGNTVEEASYVEGFTDNNVTIYTGASLDLVYDADIYEVNNDNYDYGTATVRGVLYGNWDNSTGAPNDLDNEYGGGRERYGTGSPLEGKKLYWSYDTAPHGVGGQNVTEVDIAADGTYEFDVPVYTAEDGGGYVSIYWGFYDVDDFYIVDNMAGTADSLLPAIYSSGGIQGWWNNWLQDGEVYEWNHLINPNTY
jgi:hypothetical protein